MLGLWQFMAVAHNSKDSNMIRQGCWIILPYSTTTIGIFHIFPAFPRRRYWPGPALKQLEDVFRKRQQQMESIESLRICFMYGVFTT